MSSQYDGLVASYFQCKKLRMLIDGLFSFRWRSILCSSSCQGGLIGGDPSIFSLFLCCHYDQYRGPITNNRDHLRGKLHRLCNLAKESLLFPRLTVPGACVFTVASDPGKEQQKTKRRRDALSVMSRKQKSLKNADVAQTKNCGKVDGALQRIV